MTTPYLLPDLRADEGLRLDAYPDPVTGGSPWTIGYGHTGSDVWPGLAWTAERAQDVLISDVMKAKADLDRFVGWWRGLCGPRQDALVNMTFNMGIERLLTFREMLAALEAGDFPAAAAQMLESDWARQLPRRADRLAQQMKLGARSSPPPAIPSPVPARAQSQLA